MANCGLECLSLAFCRVIGSASLRKKLKKRNYLQHRSLEDLGLLGNRIVCVEFYNTGSHR
jgi:hypothetical protein